MNDKEIKKAVKELRKKIIPNIKDRNLFNNAEKNILGQKVLRAKAILLQFDSEVGKKLEKMIDELLTYHRAKTRPEHRANLAKEIKKYIVEKTEEMAIYKATNKNDDNKGIKIKTIIKFSPIIVPSGIAIVALVLYFQGWHIKREFNTPFGFSLVPPLEQVLQATQTKPNLKFNDVIFVYYNSEDNLLGTSRDSAYQEVDLKNIKRVGFIAEVKNTSQFELLYSTKWITVRLPNGTAIKDYPPSRPSENSKIYKNDVGLIEMGDIYAEALMQSLDNDKNFFLTFEPTIEYNSEERWGKEKISFNSVMDCSSRYNWGVKKIFKPACN